MKRLAGLVLTLLLAVASGSIWAETAPPGKLQPADSVPSADHWLMGLHDAARQRAYVGTFVVTAGDYMSSARIWHVCDGQQQMERVETLTGAPRSTYRRNDQVVTFLPESRMAVQETRKSLGLFPELLSRADSSIDQFYRLKTVGHGRVAGFEADIVQLLPSDRLRFGYRIWTEHKTGLVIKLQTLDHANAVLEQAAFSELQLAQPLSMAQLSALMDKTDGYRLSKPELIKTTSDQEGWSLKARVPGFKSMSCYKRVDGALQGMGGGVLQCVFSDGLASVSLFIEAFDPRQPPHDSFAVGATHMLTRRLGSWLITAVGEVPQQTLAIFVQGLEKKN